MYCFFLYLCVFVLFCVFYCFRFFLCLIECFHTFIAIQTCMFCIYIYMHLPERSGKTQLGQRSMCKICSAKLVMNKWVTYLTRELGEVACEIFRVEFRRRPAPPKLRRLRSPKPPILRGLRPQTLKTCGASPSTSPSFRH